MLDAADLHAGSCTDNPRPRSVGSGPPPPPFSIARIGSVFVLNHSQSLEPGVYPVAIKVGDLCLPALSADQKLIALVVPEPPAPKSKPTSERTTTRKPAGETSPEAGEQAATESSARPAPTLMKLPSRPEFQLRNDDLIRRIEKSMHKQTSVQ